MPVAIPVFFTALYAGESIAIASAIYASAQIFVYAASAYLINRAVRALTPKPPKGLGRSLEANYSATDSGAPIILGQVRVGGMDCIPPITTGSSGEYLHRVLALAAHQCQSFEKAQFDDDLFDDSAFGSITGADTDGVAGSGAGKYQNKAWLRVYLGTSSQNVDYILNQVSSTAFPSTFRGRGITYAAVRYKWDEKVYTSIPAQTFIMKGAIAYDPRLDSSPGASPTNPTYQAWTANPALLLTWYLTNATIGGNYQSDEIDWTTVVTAANTCDATVNVPTSATQPRYACNGMLLASSDFAENVKLLTDAMLGRVIFRDGKWRIQAGQWQTPTFDIAKSDWASGLSITFEGGRDKRFARARCWYVDSARNYQRVECEPRFNPTYYAADGNEWNDTEFEQPLCNNEYEAQRKTELLLRQSRNQVIISGRLPPRFQDIALWDTGAISDPDLGWVDKTFRCVGLNLNPDGSVDGVFQEEQSGDWADLLEADYNAPSTIALPSINPTTPTEPQNFEVSNQINGTLRFSFDNPVIQPTGTRFQIIRSTVSNNAAVGTVVYDGLSNRMDLASPTSAQYYFARAYAGSYFGAYTPNTVGVLAVANALNTGQIAQGAATVVFQANCTATQVFSGAGAFHTSELGRDDFGALDSDAIVGVTAAYRTGLGNINGFQSVGIRFTTGVSSIFNSVGSIPVGGTTVAMQPVTQTAVFSYTKNNSATVQLIWNVASGANSFTIDQVTIKTEFIRL